MNKVSFSLIRAFTLVFVSIAIFFTSVHALEVDVAHVHVDTDKLIGMKRAAVLELLGEPLGSVEFFPDSQNTSIVDCFKSNSDVDKKLRISYDRQSNASAADIEAPPYAAPKFMGEKCKLVGLSEKKLHILLSEFPEEKLRLMKSSEVTDKFGKPDRTWQETSRAGNRTWHFLNYLYFLSTDGRKAFVVMFNEDNHSVYEYRLQSLGR